MQSSALHASSLLCALSSLWLGWLGRQALAPAPSGERWRELAAALLLAHAAWWPQWLGLPAPAASSMQLLVGAGLAWLMCAGAVLLARQLLASARPRWLRRAMALLTSLVLLAAAGAIAQRLRPGTAQDWLLIGSGAAAQATGLLLVLDSLAWRRLALRALALPGLLALVLAPGLLAMLQAQPPVQGGPELLSTDLLWLLLSVPPALSYLLRRAQAGSAGDRDLIAQLRQQQLSDPLTGLPSRQGLQRELAARVTECDRKQTGLAVISLNLDGFQAVNSGFGHEFGDQLLRGMAERLRSNSSSREFIGRIGSDEFVLLMPASDDIEAVSARARRFIQLLSAPFSAQSQEASLSCSAGIALYPEHGGASRLLACAGLAAQAAKRLGGACFAVYDPSMGHDSRSEIELLKDLREAIGRGELQLYFQPKIDAASGQVTAAEALLRWNHPSKGLISPVVFIPIAERFGLMRDVGNWVITAACTQARIWREQGLRMRVAINLSAQQMRQNDIVERISAALQEHRIQPSLLTCEITESVAMEDTRATQETFRQLGELGVHLSIDDFGTGYSSLAYLRQLPAKELKIDRSFVMDVDTNSSALAMVDAIVRLAHALNLRVVAEGVETERQQKWLLKLGCDELQGYLYAKPMSAQALLLWAKKDDETKAPTFRASLFGETEPQKLD